MWRSDKASSGSDSSVKLNDGKH